MNLPALFGIIIGLGMIGQWTALYLNKQIPELEHEPIRIRFHIAGEMATAVLLIAGGTGHWIGADWGPALFLLALGMLMYTSIVSPGYFAQKGRWVWVLVFAVIVGLAIAAAISVASIWAI